MDRHRGQRAAGVPAVPRPAGLAGRPGDRGAPPADERELAALDVASDDEVILADGPLDVEELVEDELVLTLPFAPAHEGPCPGTDRRQNTGGAHSSVPRERKQRRKHGRPTEQEVAVEARHASRARLPRRRRRSPSSPSPARRTSATTSARAATIAARRSSRPRPTSRRPAPSRRDLPRAHVVVAVDAMGGDHGPSVTVPGSARLPRGDARRASIVLVGRGRCARAALAKSRRPP